MSESPGGQAATGQPHTQTTGGVTSPSPGTVPTAPALDLATAHQSWLTTEQAALTGYLRDEWSTTGAWDTQIAKLGLSHYTHTDPMGQIIIWRFTSKPKSEFVKITAGTGLPYIVKIIGAHSGGAQKNDPNVMTSSLCRNPGALFGTAASAGGDKKVLNIINKAAYLIGIDISTLAAKGVSAHPALCRVISGIETEYVLVPTPGLPQLSLDDLATYRFRNPFQGRIAPDGTIAGSTVKLPISDSQHGYADLCMDPSFIVPDAVDLTITKAGAGTMEPGLVNRILAFAVKASPAATTMSAIIQEKEPSGLNGLLQAAQMFVRYMK
jgi:hypothetical protein